MSFIETTPPEDARDEVAAMYRRQQSSWGYVPNYAKVFCHRPRLMDSWGRLLAEIKRSMDRRRFELVTLAAACELRNSACALAHGRVLREFFTDDQIVAIAEGREAPALSRAEHAMLRFARQVARDAARIAQRDIAELRTQGFADAEIFDIAAAAAGRAFFTKLLDAVGVLADAPFLELETGLRHALTPGRPVDPAPCATMPVEAASAAEAGHAC